MLIEISSGKGPRFKFAQPLIENLVAPSVVHLHSRALVFSLKEIMDIQSNKYLAGRHLSNYVEVRGEVIHSRAVVSKNSHFEVILGQLSKNVGWLIEKKNDIVVLSDLQAYYVQLCIRTIVLGSRRSTTARPVSLNLAGA